MGPPALTGKNLFIYITQNYFSILLSLPGDEKDHRIPLYTLHDLVRTSTKQRPRRHDRQRHTRDTQRV